MKKILILGSTGSIGVNTLDVIQRFPDKFDVVGLSAHSNIDLLKQQVKEFAPSMVAVTDNNKFVQLKNELNGDYNLLSGSDGLIEIAKEADYDILVSSLVGFAGLAPTIEGIKRGKRIALANKETLVVAGRTMISLAEKFNAEIIPVDSEHSAIFQVLVGEQKSEINKIILTASGGPFFNVPFKELKTVTVEEALNHPNWDMGNKITIDSATMMNKGLEVIEASWLFNLSKSKIEVVIHPQSIVHSMIEFVDGSIKAQLSLPDMRLPIQYALTYPDRLAAQYVKTNFPKLKDLSFFEPDFEKFKCLKLAFDVMEEGGTSPCILNAANEVAVSKFLNEEIEFLQIPELIESALDHIENSQAPDLETIFECDRLTREFLM